MEHLRCKAGELLDLLRAEGEESGSAQLSAALANSDDDLARHLVSDELWLLSESALLHRSTTVRRRFEALMAELGRAQIEAGLVNQLTEFWTPAFEHFMMAPTFADIGTLPEFALLLRMVHYVLVCYKGWETDAAAEAVAQFGRRFASFGQGCEWAVLCEDEPWGLAMEIHYAEEIRTQANFFERHPELFVSPEDYWKGR